MPTTTNYGFYSPPLTGVTPNVPRDTKTLADAVDVALKAEETARIAATNVLSSRRTTTAGTSIPNNTTTTVPFPTSLLDEIPWDGTNHRWAVPTAGYYLVTVIVCFSSNATGIRTVRILVNGSAAIINQQPASSAGAISYSVSESLQLSASDLVQIAVTQTSGGALSLTASAGFNFASITRIGLN